MNRSEFLAVIMAAAHGLAISPEGAAAHAANESAWGSSGLAVDACNLFGLKRGSSWAGPVVTLPTWEVVNGQRVETTAEFRAYSSWRESIADYADVIARVYPWAAAHAHEPFQFLWGIFQMSPKWATDPAAMHKAVAILDEYGLLSISYEQLGEHAVIVDNTPTLSSAWVTALAALQSRPAVHRAPVMVTRTRRPDGSWKLDTSAS